MNSSFQKRQTMNQSALSPKGSNKLIDDGDNSPKMRSSMRQDTGLNNTNRGFKTIGSSERKTTVQAKNNLVLSPVHQPSDRKLTFQQ